MLCFWSCDWLICVLMFCISCGQSFSHLSYIYLLGIHSWYLFNVYKCVFKACMYETITKHFLQNIKKNSFSIHFNLFCWNPQFYSHHFLNMNFFFSVRIHELPLSTGTWAFHLTSWISRYSPWSMTLAIMSLPWQIHEDSREHLGHSWKMARFRGGLWE